MCSGERSSSAKGAIALRQSCARSWSISRSRVLSDWTMRGPSFTWRVYGVGPIHRLDGVSGRRPRPGAPGRPDLALTRAVRRDVGPRGAAVRAVTPGLVGGGVDVGVRAGGGAADAESGGAELADDRGEAEQGLPDQQLGDAGPRGDVQVQAGRVVVGDLGGEWVPRHQLV